MPADTYARSLKGLSINLLVRDIERALLFQREVLEVTITYHDPDFAVMHGYGAEWIMHTDHAYDQHPLLKLANAATNRGAGLELRLHGRDPDAAEAAARRLGFAVITPANDKPHGLREVYLSDADGYVWVPDVPSERPQ